ncbi:hypothetical protein GSI_02893 [Ganoderma sinense ZZ0214-1]|uniref:Uncharacterized protein n=1 Tax=Ganoderma sinense ZZ0214-1 TaxID=1077348 RepID=A0A2G8SMW0_9APHY|nr:hypothetical protein GSI_02893 [Ganoderma sinense ZZ0214-1]
MARGHDTIPALKDLADIFRDHNDACQEMEWKGTLEHVAKAIVKFTQHYLDYKVVTEISSLHSAFYLFRWVWEHRTEARGHREFFPLALRMGGHLHSSLGTAILHPDVDAHRNAFVLKSLTETLQFLSHDTHGLNLVAGLHAGAKATVERMSAQADSLPADSSVKQEFDGLKERLRTISASKNFGHQGSQHATFSPVPDSVNLNAAGPGPSTVMLRYGADLNRQGKSLRAREGYTTSPQPTPKPNPSPQPMPSDSERVQNIV